MLQALPDVVYVKTASTESQPVTYGQSLINASLHRRRSLWGTEAHASSEFCARYGACLPRILLPYCCLTQGLNHSFTAKIDIITNVSLHQLLKKCSQGSRKLGVGHVYCFLFVSFHLTYCLDYYRYWSVVIFGNASHCTPMYATLHVCWGLAMFSDELLTVFYNH